MTPTHATRDLRRIRAELLAWYDRDHRAFPWRGLTDPYAVLVSEVMLQQTQASRIAARFPRFMARFPSVEALAAAPAADLLAEWSGLGYNRRALALQRAAVTIARDGWPDTVDGLQRLPGIGPYTARAVASLAFGAPVGVVDTNHSPEGLNYVIPGNDDSSQAIRLYARGVADAILEGRNQAMQEIVKNESAEADEAIAAE